jgi:ubiquitin fusion degradation protein 1
MYRDKLTVWPMVMSNKPFHEDGDKIILPQKALLKVKPSSDGSPLIFKITNPETELSMCVGVIEFTALNGTCYVPYWIMNQLAIGEGKKLQILDCKIPKATYIKIKLHSYLSNPKAFLEVALRKFTCLNKDTTFSIPYMGQKLNFDVIDTKPESSVCVVDVECDLEFEEISKPPSPVPERRTSVHRRNSAVDLQNPVDLSSDVLPDKMQNRLDQLAKKKTLQPLKKFPGKGRRLGKK